MKFNTVVGASTFTFIQHIYMHTKFAQLTKFEPKPKKEKSEPKTKAENPKQNKTPLSRRCPGNAGPS
jgi:hypothetical protein